MTHCVFQAQEVNKTRIDDVVWCFAFRIRKIPTGYRVGQ